MSYLKNTPGRTHHIANINLDLDPEGFPKNERPESDEEFCPGIGTWRLGKDPDICADTLWRLWPVCPPASSETYGIDGAVPQHKIIGQKRDAIQAKRVQASLQVKYELFRATRNPPVEITTEDDYEISTADYLNHRLVEKWMYLRSKELVCNFLHGVTYLEETIKSYPETQNLEPLPSQILSWKRAEGYLEPFEDCLEIARQLKDEGNAHYNKYETPLAAWKYLHAMAALAPWYPLEWFQPMWESRLSGLSDMVFALGFNMIMCAWRLGNGIPGLIIASSIYQHPFATNRQVGKAYHLYGRCAEMHLMQIGGSENFQGLKEAERKFHGWMLNGFEKRNRYWRLDPESPAGPSEGGDFTLEDIVKAATNCGDFEATGTYPEAKALEEVVDSIGKAKRDYEFRQTVQSDGRNWVGPERMAGEDAVPMTRTRRQSGRAIKRTPRQRKTVKGKSGTAQSPQPLLVQPQTGSIARAQLSILDAENIIQSMEDAYQTQQAGGHLEGHGETSPRPTSGESSTHSLTKRAADSTQISHAAVKTPSERNLLSETLKKVNETQSSGEKLVMPEMTDAEVDWIWTKVVESLEVTRERITGGDGESSGPRELSVIRLKKTDDPLCSMEDILVNGWSGFSADNTPNAFHGLDFVDSQGTVAGSGTSGAVELSSGATFVASDVEDCDLNDERGQSLAELVNSILEDRKGSSVADPILTSVGTSQTAATSAVSTAISTTQVEPNPQRPNQQRSLPTTALPSGSTGAAAVDSPDTLTSRANCPACECCQAGNQNHEERIRVMELEMKQMVRNQVESYELKDQGLRSIEEDEAFREASINRFFELHKEVARLKDLAKK